MNIPSPGRQEQTPSAMRRAFWTTRRAARFATQTIQFAGQAARGYREFLRTGTTSASAYSAMRELSWRTNGRYNDVMATLSSLRHPPRKLALARGVLGELTRESVGRMADHIRRDGYYIFERKLPDHMQQALTEIGLRLPAKPLVIPKDDSFTRFEYNWLPACRYDRTNILSTMYNFDLQLVAEQHVVQELLTDETILAVARAYLGTEPVIKQSMAMWWSTNYLRGKASSLAAQHFHFDLDGIKFLKFFFYLNDVGPDNGPHCYVRGSHKRKPRNLLRDGRIADEEILTHYTLDDIVEITGGRGTVFVADTRGLHKGKAIRSGERLMAQLEFATSLFGPEHQRIAVNGRFSAEFRQCVRQYPRVFAIYDA